MDDLKVYGKKEKQIDTLVQAARVVSADMRMEVGIAKYVMLVMKRGNVVQCYGIPVTWQQEGESADRMWWAPYKYLGVLEADGTKHQEMNEPRENSTLSALEKPSSPNWMMAMLLKLSILALE